MGIQLKQVKQSLRCLIVIFLGLFVTLLCCTIPVLENHSHRVDRALGKGKVSLHKDDFVVAHHHPADVTTKTDQATASSPRQLIRFDDACPSLYNPITPVLSSIPAANMTLNATEPLFTYNPTIHKYNYNKNRGTFDESTAVYIASFRVGTYPWLEKDYLGVALLNAQLEIQKHVVLDVNLYATHQYATKKKKRKDRKESASGLLFSDYRLVWYNDTYFVTNGIAIVVLSIDENDDEHTPIPIVFDGGLSVQARSPIRKIRKVEKGRNFNFYSLSGTSHWLLEEWPLPTPRYVKGGRRVSSIRIFDDWRFEAQQSWDTTPNVTIPEPSWQGPDMEFHRKSGNLCDDRGTVCCIKLEKEYYQDLQRTSNKSKNEKPSNFLRDDYILVGISHVKSFKRAEMGNGVNKRFHYAYFSRFYATRPTIPPTDIVAQSGLFCFRGLQNISNYLEWNGVAYNCPIIQFPSGMTASATDPSMLIVAYGIDDITSRIVQIKKRDLAVRLFFGSSTTPNATNILNN